MRRELKEFISLDAIKHLVYIPKIVFNVKNWHDFLLNYIGFRDSSDLFVFRNGLKLRTIEGIDTATIMVTLIRKDYGKFKPNSTIIDIGANIGTYSIAAAKKIGVMVYAYEPMPETYKILVENIGLNKLRGKIKTFNLGVGSKKGKRKLYLSPHSCFHSMHHKTKKSVEIKCITLKDVFDDNKIKKCDILKMDCEGAEYEIFFNTPEKYLNKIKDIRLEYHNLDKENNIDVLVDFLGKKGFRIVRMKKDSDYSGSIWLRRNLVK